MFNYSTALSVHHVTDIEVFLTVQSPSGYVYPIVSRSNATQRNSDALHRILILHLAYQACSSTGSQFKVAPVVPDLLSMPGVLHHPPMPISPWAPPHGHVPLITELAALCSSAGIHWLCPICQSAFGEAHANPTIHSTPSLLSFQLRCPSYTQQPTPLHANLISSIHVPL